MTTKFTLTEKEFEIQGNFGQGYECVTSEMSYKAAREQIKLYRENEPRGTYRIVFKRALRTFSLKELKALPTLSTGHFDDLKAETKATRVLLSRMTVADGMPYNNQVTVERLIRGNWKAVETYQAI